MLVQQFVRAKNREFCLADRLWGEPPVTSQMASNAESVAMPLRHVYSTKFISSLPTTEIAEKKYTSHNY